MNSSAARALRHPRYRRFFVASWLVQLGFWFSHVSFQDLMSDLTDDELWNSLLFVAAFGPILLLTGLGGVIVDRVDRRRLVIAGYCAICVIAIGQVALVALDRITPLSLVIVACLFGCALATIDPAVAALTANLVPAEDLSSAISLGATSANISRIVGPAIAAPFLAGGFFEVGWTIYALAAGSAAAIVLTISYTPTYTRESRDGRHAGRGTFRSGFDHARERTPTLAALSIVAAVATFGVAHVTLLPAFARDQLGRDAGDFVWIAAATGIGAVVGSLAAGSLGERATLRRGGFLALPYCLALLLFSQTTSLPVAVVLQIPLGFFYFGSFTTLQVLIQQLVDDEYRGRVMALFAIAWAGCLPLGGLAMGIMAGPTGLDLGPSTTIAITASLAALWTTGVLAFDARRLRIANEEQAVDPLTPLEIEGALAAGD